MVATLFCGTVEEDVNHVLRQCPPTRFIWEQLIKTRRLEEFMGLNFRDWVLCNVSDEAHFPRYSLNLGIRFGAIVWNLWLRRNALVFNTDTAVHGGVILQSRKLVEIMLRVRQDDDQHRCLQQYPTSTPSRWSLSPDPFIKINTDGEKFSSLGRAIRGGVARNSDGDWCFGFAKFIGVCSVLDAEV
ncbi:hypothetical protein V6N12_050692 [Hibiscus sabdariffa]|uniref:Reverse transcriptase zinc-binding domain-containing protein n=1 Tax=Hibiscus sabdariffa TaxID=183260 RepID=A0ABR2GEV7_9ROSI